MTPSLYSDTPDQTQGVAPAERLRNLAAQSDASGDYAHAVEMREQARVFDEARDPLLRAQRLILQAEGDEKTAAYFDHQAAEHRSRKTWASKDPAEEERIALAMEEGAHRLRDKAGIKRVRAAVVRRAALREIEAAELECAA